MKSATSAIMKAIRVSEFGGPEVCKLLSDVAVPKPGPKQMLMRVKYASVNPHDTYVRAGTYTSSPLPSLPYTPGVEGCGVIDQVNDGARYKVLIRLYAAGVNPVETYIVSGTHTIKPSLPFTPGGDGAGLVSEVGPDVTGIKAGDRVFSFHSLTGSYAQYTLVNEADVFPLPESVSFIQGAALGVPYFTAATALRKKARAQEGETVLIHGASGACGIAACQIAKSLGLRVIGTASSDEGLKIVKENGADHVFNHKEEGYMQKIMASANNGEGPDIIIEMLANVNLEEDMKIACFNGRIVIVGNRGSIEITPRLAMTKELTIYGMMLFKQTAESLAETSEFLVRGLQAGWLRPVVGETYPLEQAGQAQKEVIAHTGGAKGKIVLQVD